LVFILILLGEPRQDRSCLVSWLVYIIWVEIDFEPFRSRVDYCKTAGDLLYYFL
jgi:hypothetical protein